MQLTYRAFKDWLLAFAINWAKVTHDLVYCSFSIITVIYLHDKFSSLILTSLLSIVAMAYSTLIFFTLRDTLHSSVSIITSNRFEKELNGPIQKSPLKEVRPNLTEWKTTILTNKTNLYLILAASFLLIYDVNNLAQQNSISLTPETAFSVSLLSLYLCITANSLHSIKVEAFTLAENKERK